MTSKKLKSTMRQEKLAEVLTDLDNPPKSKREAVIRAGYSREVARVRPGRVIANYKVQELVERKKVKKDDVSRLAYGGKDLIEQALKDAAETRDPMLKAQIAAMSITAAAKLVDTGMIKKDSSTEEEAQSERKWIIKLVSTVTRWAAEGKDAHLRRYLRWFVGLDMENLPES